MKRCDHLPLLNANPGKIRALLDVLAAFRAAAPLVAADQWRRFFETGRFAKKVSDKAGLVSPLSSVAKGIIGAARLQMLRHQVVGQLESFTANRANDFRDTVLGSSLDEATRHQLLTINRAGAWFERAPMTMRTGPLKGQVIPDDIRRLARTIMRGVLKRHRRPRFHRLNPWIDQRQAKVLRKAPGTGGAALSSLWVAIRGVAATIRLPLQGHGFFEARGGQLARTVQLIERPASAHTIKTGRATHRLACGRPGELVFGLVSDMAEAFEASRNDYTPLREELALDFGLAAMFATPDGDLLGRGWFDQLKRHDARIDGLARKLQRQGLRPSRSRCYRARVAAFRGFLKTEIGRVLNRLVALKRPAHIVIEKLDFRAPGLSRRLNRILARSGRAVIREKLKDLGERFGITFAEVNPAYSSQTCSCCGFVAKANRRSQAEFSCRACGHTIHADVNAARNLESGRSAFDREARFTKADSLRLTVHRHLERFAAGRLKAIKRSSGAFESGEGHGSGEKTRDRVIPAAVLRSPYYKALRQLRMSS